MFFRMDCALAPLREVVPMAFFSAYVVEVLRLTVHCVLNDTCFWILSYRAQLSLPQRKKVAEDYESDDDDDVNSEGGLDSTHHKLSDSSESGRGLCSLCSSFDSELEMDPGTSGEDFCVAAADACADAAAGTDVSDDSEQSMPQNHRAANHAHTAWQNEHFIITAGRALQSSAAPAARKSLEGPCTCRPLLQLEDLGAQPLWR